MTSTDDWPAQFKGVKAGPERKALYATYLRSAHWKAARAGALERAEGSCQTCNGKNKLQVHHRTYERVGQERPADLIVLCHKCHALFHGISKSGKKKGQKQPKKGRSTARDLVIFITKNLPSDVYSSKQIAKLYGATTNSVTSSLAAATRHPGTPVRRISKRQWSIKTEVPANKAARRGERRKATSDDLAALRQQLDREVDERLAA